MKTTFGLASWLPCLALGLAACGGGSDAPALPTPPTAVLEVPASALASVPAWSGYIAALPVADTGPPLEIGDDATPPVSDTEAPLPVGG